jgi:hypothetical protein
VVLYHVGRPESNIYLCVSEQICDFVDKRAMESESDPVFTLRSRCSQCCMLFLKYFVSYVMYNSGWQGIAMGDTANHVPF